MRTDGWHLTSDLDAFLARAGRFLRSRPAAHTTQLTALEKARRGEAELREPVFGWLEDGGEVRAAVYQFTPARRLTVTSLAAGQAGSLAALLVGERQTVPGVLGEHDTVAELAARWTRLTGAQAERGWYARLHRLGTLTPPQPVPAGRARQAGTADRDQVVAWCREFTETVGEVPRVDAATWDTSRFADRHFTFWETPDGTPVSFAAVTSALAGMVRVDPVHTPAPLRGRGYAGAVTVAVSRAALDAGATDVVLYADPDNPTSTGLYRRIGYVSLADWSGYDFH
ncbi:GNAT family N-acetyltransferase [Streptomyces sp. NPDC058417]|uniref:GNAT family N-acetyltransferase n=1 Tax=unclassified Streptomyces TaxID=2593676 RepID=UPI00364CFE44